MNGHEHTAKDEPPAKPTQEEVAKEAYAIYTKEVKPQGHAEQNWLASEAKLQLADSMHPDEAGRQGHHVHMAEDFRKRFWISLVLTLPILTLSPMLQKLVGLCEAIHFSGDI